MFFSSLTFLLSTVCLVSVHSVASNFTTKECEKYCDATCNIYQNQTESSLCNEAKQSCPCGGTDSVVLLILKIFGLALTSIVMLLSTAAIYQYCKFGDCIQFRSSKVNKKRTVPVAVTEDSQ